MKILYRGADAIFARAMRDTYHIDVRDDDPIEVGASDAVTLVLVPPGLILQLVRRDGGEVTVLPVLITHDPAQRLPAGGGHAQPAIDALNDLLFRRATPTEGVQ